MTDQFSSPQSNPGVGSTSTGATPSTSMGASPQSEAERNLESSKHHASQAAEELRAAAAAKANEFRGYAEHRWDEARHRAEDWRTDGERYIRANPTKAVLYALGAGFILGVIFKK